MLSDLHASEWVRVIGSGFLGENNSGEEPHPRVNPLFAGLATTALAALVQSVLLI